MKDPAEAGHSDRSGREESSTDSENDSSKPRAYTKDEIAQIQRRAIAGIELPVRKRSKSANSQQVSGSEKFIHVPLDDLEHASIEPPQFVLEYLLPRGYVTLFSSHGGLGKTTLGLTLAAHIAAGVGWGGLTVQKCRVLFVSLEDGAELLRYRLKRIIETCELNPAHVQDLTVIDGSSGDGTFAVERQEGGVRNLSMTASWLEVQELAEGCGLIIIDNASDAYGGDENVRRQVRFFLRRLSSLAQETNAALLLLAHIDKIAAKHGSNDNSYSGSTAWHNSARSRLALLKDDENGIHLRHEKSNLGPLIDDIGLDWDGPVLMPLVRDRVAESLRQDKDSESVLTAIVVAIDNGDTIPAALSGPKQAYHVLENYPELPAHLSGDQKGRKRLRKVITQLIRDKKLNKVEYKTDQRNVRERLEPTQHQRGDASEIVEKSALNNTPHTPHPPPTRRVGARVSGDCDTNADQRTTNATNAGECLNAMAIPTLCPRCAGEGCGWCEH